VQADLDGDFGSNKYRVGVQIKSGAFVPDGTTTLGSVIQIVERKADGTVDSTTTCTTDTVQAGTVTSCGSGPFFSTPGDTVELTQLSAPAGLVVDPTVITLPVCTDPIPQFGCLVGDQTFTDNGLPPAAADDTADVLTGEAVDVPVLANDELNDAPVTDLQISSAPAHGTATIEPPVTTTSTTLRADADGPSTPVVHYVPDPGYVGPDVLQYTVSTANGSATGTLSISVAAPPPTAADDHASTKQGHSVTVDVTANDDAMGGGALAIDSVGKPAHGTARIQGTHVVYTPADGFAGADEFSYVVSTPFGTAEATVTVTVIAAPSTTSAAPTSTPPPATTTPADTSSSGLSSTGTDSNELITLGGGLLLVGGAASVGGRRRRRPRRAH
jgi:LPXTG-motif cell wall-anchored protein